MTDIIIIFILLIFLPESSQFHMSSHNFLLFYIHPYILNNANLRRRRRQKRKHTTEKSNNHSLLLKDYHAKCYKRKIGLIRNTRKISTCLQIYRVDMTVIKTQRFHTQMSPHFTDKHTSSLLITSIPVLFEVLSKSHVNQYNNRILVQIKSRSTKKHTECKA